MIFLFTDPKRKKEDGEFFNDFDFPTMPSIQEDRGKREEQEEGRRKR